jgi:type IVB pilus formation R64 PilN family outer membrane protein
MVQALAQQGRVSMLTQPSVTTLNMEPVPIQVAKSTAYLEQSQTLLSGGASELAQTTLTPGSVTAGFNMNVMPFILPDDKNMLLQFSIGLSALSGPIRSFESNGSRIELPELEQSIFSQKVRIKSGETLVLSGYEQSALAGTRQGVGDSRFWAFGGGGATDNRRQVIVILITPVLQD